MKVVSVINYKGGVGKTTLTACLASCLQDKGVNVLLVDLDPQCNLTGEILSSDLLDALYSPDGQKRQGGPRTLREWYRSLCNGQTENLEDLILQGPLLLQRSLRLSVIPSHLDLLDVDTQLAIRLLGTDIRAVHSDSCAGHRRYYDALSSLRSQLRAIEESRAAKGKGFDLALLDCPPNFNIITQTAIIASDEILIPVRPNPLSAMGMDHLIRKRGDLVRDFNASAKALGLHEAELTAPRILGTVSMMWKALNEDTPVKGNETVIHRTLRKLEGDGVVFFDGIRHNETLFSNIVGVANVPFSEKLYPSERPYGRVRDDIWATCSKIGEALGVIPPSFSLKNANYAMLAAFPTPLSAPTTTPEQAGNQISEEIHHLSGAAAVQAQRDVEKALMQLATVKRDVARKIFVQFWKKLGSTPDDLARKQSEFDNQTRSD